ncbi:MAG: hypothetical protein COU69_03570 [Candidatus Pacebacteria bacterium CG10_big_fil_rev_8_21_14_0_10_56_10]|nr:MAG: hypothetical protein COU69_03570 [Candidatus Pacebacteria bacterium CG10_big_fil_rev_8_21_14_0_10_56_10]
MMKRTKPTIAILGGMGPQASAEVLARVMWVAQQRFGAETADQFPEVILSSVPIPEFFESRSDRRQAEAMLVDRVRELSRLPIDGLALACNTAHQFLPALQAVTEKPFINLPGEVIFQAQQKNWRRVGLLASPVTTQSRLFERSADRAGISLVTPGLKDRRRLGQAIGLVIAGDRASARRQVLAVAAQLELRDVEAIILGCTELSLIFSSNDTSLPLLDSVQILAEKIAEIYYNQTE